MAKNKNGGGESKKGGRSGGKKHVKIRLHTGPVRKRTKVKGSAKRPTLITLDRKVLDQERTKIQEFLDMGLSGGHAVAAVVGNRQRPEQSDTVAGGLRFVK